MPRLLRLFKTDPSLAGLRNPDGSVEVLAAGEEVAIAALQRWLQHGPPLARVDAVVRFEAAAAAVAGAGFTTG